MKTDPRVSLRPPLGAKREDKTRQDVNGDNDDGDDDEDGADTPTISF